MIRPMVRAFARGMIQFFHGFCKCFLSNCAKALAFLKYLRGKPSILLSVLRSHAEYGSANKKVDAVPLLLGNSLLMSRIAGDSVASNPWYALLYPASA